jgi:hypothetical protein
MIRRLLASAAAAVGFQWAATNADSGNDMTTTATLFWASVVLIVIVITVVRERRRQAAERALPPAPPVGVVVTPGPNHIVDLILTVLTCGAWGLIWLLVALDEKREIHMLDASGHGKDTDRARRRLVVDRIVSSAHLLPRLAELRFVGFFDTSQNRRTWPDPG